jgi:hypothetical protein
MCRNRNLALFALAASALAGPALGQSADLRQASCAQFLDLPPAERGQLGLWLHGFYAGAAQRSILERSKLEDGVKALQEACERNRAMPLIGMEARAILTGEPSPVAPPAQPPSAAPAPAAPAPAPALAAPPAAAPGAPARPTPLR